MIRTALLAAVIATTLFLSGCMLGRIERPDGYLEITSGPRYEKRFLSVDGNVIAVRMESNPKGGTLDYWSQAVRKELIDVAGYALKDSQPIKAGRAEGILFDFRTPVGGVEHTYLAAVFVVGRQIAVVEAGGRSETIAADRDKLLTAIQSVR